MAKVTPELSVVVPTHNRGRRLANLLDALRRQTLDAARFEVVVVDDGSADPARQTLAPEVVENPALRILRHDVAKGPAAARNTGWRSAGGRIVAFTDDDCEPAPNWLEAIVDAVREGPSGAVIQGRTEPIPREVPSIGPFARTLTVTQLGPFYPTCNMAYPREVLERLGGFNESYPSPGGEDTDLGCRAMEAGVTIVYAEDALVYHAVNQYGPLGKLRWALHWSDAIQVLADHPRLRRELQGGVFWKRSHAQLLLALIGVLVGRRFRLGYLLAVPYARHLRGRCIAENASSALGPYLAAYDAVETYATIRGAVRHRVLVL